jgi:hypothetical protein
MSPGDDQREIVFIGWDVGGWNCDKNPRSRDALVILDASGTQIGQAWRGNLRQTINASTSGADFLDAILALCSLERPAGSVSAILAIDAPLGFPEAFSRLIVGGAVPDPIRRSAENPYLYRFTERRLVAEGVTPLSTIKDMIGSQSTKAMHVIARFAERVALGVWSDGAALTLIETYPALCRARLGQAADGKSSAKTGREADILDAEVCARIARDFHLRRETLDAPPIDAPLTEGWIWAPLPRGDNKQDFG